MREEWSSASLRRALRDAGEDVEALAFDLIDSTNAEARRRAVEGIDRPLLIAAAEQTAGRGRLGRSFHSPADAGVYFSLLIPTREPLANAVSVTCAASVAVMRAILRTTGKQTGIKWVNDLYWKGKKVCGILAESFSMGDCSYVIIGVGVNLRPYAFPEELSQIAGSLDDGNASACELIAQTAHELLSFWKTQDRSAWLDDYRAHSVVLGKRVRWTADGVTREGIAESIGADGALTVRDADGVTHDLRTGEISVRLSAQ